MPPCQSTAYGRRMDDDFTWMDGTGQAELVRNGDVSAVKLVDAAIATDVLLRLAGQLEQARPWSDRRPPV